MWLFNLNFVFEISKSKCVPLFACDFRLAALRCPQHSEHHPHHLCGICHWPINSIDLCSSRQFKSQTLRTFSSYWNSLRSQIEFLHFLFIRIETWNVFVGLRLSRMLRWFQLLLFLLLFHLSFLAAVHGWTSRVQEFNVFMNAFSMFIDLFFLRHFHFKSYNIIFFMRLFTHSPNCTLFDEQNYLSALNTWLIKLIFVVSYWSQSSRCLMLS